MTRLLIKPGLPGQPALWTFDGKGRAQATDADEIGLSDALADRIEEWLDDIDAATGENGARVFETSAAREALAADGAVIAAAIRGELPEWTVDLDLADLGGIA
jgi:hypothetical protein